MLTLCSTPSVRSLPYNSHQFYNKKWLKVTSRELTILTLVVSQVRGEMRERPCPIPRHMFFLLWPRGSLVALRETVGRPPPFTP